MLYHAEYTLVVSLHPTVSSSRMIDREYGISIIDNDYILYNNLEYPLISYIGLAKYFHIFIVLFALIFKGE